MKYPIDYASFVEEVKQKGIEVDERIKGFVRELIVLMNDSYYQGRLDESLRGGNADE